MSFTPLYSGESDQLNICRCCLSKECCKDIFTEFHDSGNKEVYQEMLKDVFNIQISNSFSVKQFICEECIKRLRASTSFKNMVIKNQEMYLECLQNYLNVKDNNVLQMDLKLEEIKNETLNMDFDKYHEDHISYNDDDILINMKMETEKVSELDPEKTKNQSRPGNNSKSERCKEKKIETHERLTDRRGTGPILRDNSLKLLANSTATVFQWNKSQYTCFCCQQPFPDMDTLRNHTEKEHTIEDIQKRIIIQQNRLVKVEITLLNCKICNEHLPDLDKLRQHLIEHTILVGDHLLIPFRIGDKLMCQLCLEPFARFRLLNIHMNRHYQKHVCHVCGAGFSNLVFLSLHRTRSHRPIECQKCQAAFKSRSEKRSHDIEVHKVKFEKKQRFPCPYCSSRFCRENLRVLHLVEEHGMEKPEFGCQFCSKCFVTRSLVNNHVKVVHKKEKCHECHVCHSFFYSKSDVSRHSVTHTGERNFSCSLCSSLFASKDSLRRHMKRTHVAH